MVLKKITYSLDGKNKKIKVKICDTFLGKFLGLMFKKNSQPLLFVFDKTKTLSIHSLFCKPFLAVWKQRHNQAKQEYEQGRISKAQLAKVEEAIAIELSQRIQQEISVDVSGEFFDLTAVIKHKQTQCLGYTQLFYILGSSLGLSVQAINVEELVTPDPLTPGRGHIACIVDLADETTIIVD